MDYSVVAIMLTCAIIAMLSGFVRTIFRLASFFIAVTIAVSFYPLVANYIINNTSLYRTVKTVIEQKISSDREKKESNIPSNEETVQSQQAIDFSKFPLPDNIKQQLGNIGAAVYGNKQELTEYRQNNDVQTAAEHIAHALINILSALIIFAVAGIILAFIRNILEWIAELPIFYQLNKAGGFILGGIEGLLIVYFICAILAVFATSENLKTVFLLIDASLYAKHIYYNNFLLDWILSPRVRWKFW